MKPRHKSVETRYMEERQAFFDDLKKLDRRSFLKVSAAALGITAANGLVAPTSFQPVKLAYGATPEGGEKSFRFAYISDSHLYEKDVNDRFARSLMRAVDDVNRLEPQPDFVFYGGDLAQLGQAAELELGAQILKNLKVPLKIMVGEHDWYLDMGEKWQALFGKPTESWDHKGVHFVKLLSVIEEDFWTARGMKPMERMQTVAGLDNGVQKPFTVGPDQRAWLKKDLEKLADDAPVVVFSHSPLYKIYKNWNFWTDDADEVQAILKRFKNVTVIHGHTHQMLTNRIGNIHFHGLLATAWPWPYAPEGMPELTVQMTRPDPFNPQDGCGDGEVCVYSDGMVDKIHNFWNRNPVTVTRAYMSSRGRQSGPAKPNRPAY
ncbi:MAG TPA: metallophosphoesterase [Phycisphaerae bacterium]|nr:metallophosphoesterase [Phycisphaerae bacterium]HRY67511.1 metallophosphoesterase [Phycisphaerae bacterium]HSA24898.1 metallophosphoesterase [Phycisphaerae bacterium]